MTEELIGKRYALALFNSAEATDSVQTIKENLLSVSELWKKNTEFRTFLEAPHISTGEKEKSLQVSFKEKISKLLMQFLLFLLRKERFQHVSEIAAQYDKLLKAKLGIIEAVVTTASPIDKRLILSLQEKLESKTGKSINMILETDPSLIGGIRVILGNQIIEYSISSELSKLKESLLSLKV